MVIHHLVIRSNGKYLSRLASYQRKHDLLSPPLLHLSIHRSCDTKPFAVMRLVSVVSLSAKIDRSYYP